MGGRWTSALAERGRRLASAFLATPPGDFARRAGHFDLMGVAASLSFYSLLSLAPLVLLLLWISTALYPTAQEEFFRQIALLAGPEAEQTTRLIVGNAQSEPGVGSIAAVLGTGALLLGASIVFAQLQTALNRIFVAENAALGGALAWVRKRLLGLGVIVGLGFLLVVSMAAHALMLAFSATLGLPGLVPALSLVVSLVLYALMFAAVYRLLPDRPVRGWTCLLGGAITAAMFLVGRWGIGLYLGHAAVGSAYGPAGGVVVLLFWVYYCSVVFLMGALVTAMLDERPPPEGVARPGDAPGGRH